MGGGGTAILCFVFIVVRVDGVTSLEVFDGYAGCKLFKKLSNFSCFSAFSFSNLSIFDTWHFALYSSSSSVGATARCGLWPFEQYLSIFPCPSPTLSIFSLPALEDFFLLST